MNLSPAVTDNIMAKTIQNNELADLFRLLITVTPGSFFSHLIIENTIKILKIINLHYEILKLV